MKYPARPINSGEVVTGGWGLLDHANDTEEHEICENSFDLVRTNLMDIKKCRTFYSRARQISITR